MTFFTSSMLAVSILAFSTLSTVVDGQIRHRNRPVRLLEKVVLDSQDRVLEESLSDEMMWVDFSMDLSLSLSMSMEDGWTPNSKKGGYGKGPKGEYGQGSHVPLDKLAMGDESIPEATVDHKVLLKRSYVEDAHDAMKLVKT